MENSYKFQCKCGTAIMIKGIDVANAEARCLKCDQTIIATKQKDFFATLFEPGDGESNASQNIGNYTVVDCLGEGAMGEVYLAQNQHGDKVAIKILQKPDNKKMLEYFSREAEILLKLEHPNLVSLIEQGEHEEQPYIAMEYLCGKTLKQLISESKTLAPKKITKIIYQVLKGLEHAYAKKIIHRDIKPENIFVTNVGVVKLIDMGISKMLDTTYKLTITGEILGTIYYMPPEQLKNAKGVDHRADIYALGATLFHALCGMAPCGEYKGNIHHIISAKLESKYTSLTKINPDLPAKIVEIAEKAMANQPQDRYQSHGEMKQELIDFYKSN